MGWCGRVFMTHKQAFGVMERTWPSYFVTSPLSLLGGGVWSWALVGYRAVLLSIMGATMALSLLSDARNGCVLGWSLYFTHIMLMLQVLYLTLSLWVTVRWRGEVGKVRPRSVPFGVRLLWVLQDTQLVGTGFVALVYWAFIDTEVHRLRWTYAWTTHGLNFGVALLDAVTRHEFAVSTHFVTLGVFAAGYAGFTVCFWLFGGTNCHGEHWIYEALDYDQPLTWVLVILTIPTVAAVYLVVCWIFDRTDTVPVLAGPGMANSPTRFGVGLYGIPGSSLLKAVV